MTERKTPIILTDAERAAQDSYRRELWARQPVVDRDDRESIISWLCWNDPNGCYSDEDMIAEGFERGMTLDEARAMLDQALADC